MLTDGYSSQFRYLRLSLTEACNFRCSYCLPHGYKACSRPKPLSVEEIKNLAKAFKNLGVKKIRLTGGEPTLRSDLIEIIHILKNEIHFDEVALTTNGFRLKKISGDLKNAGLDTVNISLDSLKPNVFKEICGVDRGQNVLDAIERCFDLNFQKVKLNCVLLKDINDGEFLDFIKYVKTRPISVRFIELMRTGSNQDYFKNHHISVVEKRRLLEEMNWKLIARSEVGGPAQEYGSNHSRGRIGFISPYSRDFCVSCNRLRVSAVGRLRLCLFGMGDIDLRDCLDRADREEELQERIIFALRLKPKEHQLQRHLYGDMRTLSAIGG